MAVVTTLMPGNTNPGKIDPFTIFIVSNPALEAPWRSGTYVVDPITANQAVFNACAQYIVDSVFGRLPGQAEKVMQDPSILPEVRVISLFVAGLPPEANNALIGQDGASNILVPLRANHQPFLIGLGYRADEIDIVYAVSMSGSHTRASAYPSTDDNTRGGVPFLLDGALTLNHRQYTNVPGTIGIHATATSLTAMHEFGHALSSFNNGKITDLYVDSGVEVNNKNRTGGATAGVPANYGTYDTTAYVSDIARDGLGYPPSWVSYHCQLLNGVVPAVMDNYWLAAPPNVPETCEHDAITRHFVRERMLSKIARP